jgi:type I restriction enzyme S subunit
MKSRELNLPSSWRTIRIGDLCDLKNGRAFKPEDWSPKGLPIVRIQNLNNPDASFNHFDGEVRDRFMIDRGNLLFAWSGTPGTSFGAHIWRGGRAVLNQHIFRVDFDERRLNKIYFMHAINDRLTELIEKAHGGVGLRHVTKGKFEETTIPVPPLAEQHRIVAKIEELFSDLGNGVESLTTARKQLKSYRQAVLKHAFSGKLTVQWRDANDDKVESAFLLIARIKKDRELHYQAMISVWNTAPNENGGKPRPPKTFLPLGGQERDELPALPDSWVWERLGWMTCGVEYGTAAKSLKSGSVPVLRMGNIQNAKFDWSDLVYTSDEDEILKYALKAGDVLFNRTNSPELVGKTAIYRGERPALFAGYLIRINQIPSIVDSQYLNLYLNSHIARQQGNRVKTDGVNQSNINGEKLSNYPFPYCSLAEQREIVNLLEEKLSIIDQLEENVEQEVKKSEALRQSILRKAFFGQLVPQDQSDEPASVLLERIKALNEDGGCRRKKNKNGKKEAA